jgi:hypothetical protein
MQDAGRGRRTAVGGLIGLLVSSGCNETSAPAEPEDASTSETIGSSGMAETSDAGPPGQPVPLVRSLAWEVASAAEDPFADHRPSFVQCEIGWDVETGVFEVDTALCTYAAFVQPSLAPIHAGDLLELVLLHDDLYFAEGEAVAHVAVAFGSEVAWETELPIPSQAGQARPTWTAPADVEIGTPVHFHVHNHGTNNYRLVALTVAAR